MCARCRRPTKVCYCAALPKLDTTTKVVILQHPRERDMPIGTARMASLCLAGAELHVGVRWGESAALAAALADLARPPILLYPGPGAKNILDEPPMGPVTLVVVDGTWSQAKVVVRDNPILQGLPRYAFAAPEPSQYRIRREPKPEYVSTIEALMHVLGALEGDPARFRAMLAPLRAMVDAQLACQVQAPRRTTLRQPRARPPEPRVPALLTVRRDDLVCVVAEANAWPYDSSEHRPDELVHLVARRIATGEQLEMIAAPSELSPSTPYHTGLTAAELRAGGSRGELVAALAAFVRPSDVLCTWGSHPLQLLAVAGSELASSDVTRCDLRQVAQRWRRGKVGPLERFAATLGEVSPPPLACGRAGARLAMLVGMIEHWQREAAAAAPPSARDGHADGCAL